MKCRFKLLTSVLLSSVISISVLSPSFSQEDVRVIRLSGKDRVQTSIQTAKISGEESSKTIVLASAYNFADALSSFNLVKKYDARLILVNNNSDITETIRLIGADRAYIVGGDSVIGGRVASDVRAMISNTKRIAGRNRYETNAKTLIESGFRTVGVADGRNYPDALSSSGLLASKNYGLMLVNGSKRYTTNYDVAYTFGGKSSVFQDGGIRIAGKNRYETSILINNQLGGLKNLAVAYGENFADALSATNVINLSSSDTGILLVKENMDSRQFAITKGADKVYIVGGSVNYRIEDKINGAPEEINGTYGSFDINSPLTVKERNLARLVNEYRISRGLKPLDVSKSLTFVARTHVNDQAKNNPEKQNDERGIQGNLHSWSNKGSWTPVAYTSDHYHAKGMWSKPSELTKYKGNGYEISYSSSGEASPYGALSGWKSSPGHNAVIIEDDKWKDTINVMGVSICGGYSNIWFGSYSDPDGYHIQYSDAKKTRDHMEKIREEELKDKERERQREEQKNKERELERQKEGKKILEKLNLRLVSESFSDLGVFYYIPNYEKNLFEVTYKYDGDISDQKDIDQLKEVMTTSKFIGDKSRPFSFGTRLDPSLSYKIDREKKTITYVVNFISFDKELKGDATITMYFKNDRSLNVIRKVKLVNVKEKIEKEQKEKEQSQSQDTMGNL